jgi:hypothetical protein
MASDQVKIRSLDGRAGGELVIKISLAREVHGSTPRRAVAPSGRRLDFADTRAHREGMTASARRGRCAAEM